MGDYGGSGSCGGALGLQLVVVLWCNCRWVDWCVVGVRLDVCLGSERCYE